MAASEPVIAFCGLAAFHVHEYVYRGLDVFYEGGLSCLCKDLQPPSLLVERILGVIVNLIQ